MVYHPPSQVGGHRCCSSRDKMFLICHVVKQDHIAKSQVTMTIRAPKVSHHDTNFGGNRHCGTRDIRPLVCHVIFLDPMIKGSSDFFCRSSSSFLWYTHSSRGHIITSNNTSNYLILTKEMLDKINWHYNAMLKLT